MPKPHLLRLREQYHKRVCREILGRRSDSGCWNLADRSSNTSVAIAEKFVQLLGYPVALKPPKPQACGSLFGDITRDFLERALAILVHLRPGTWGFSTSQAAKGIAAFEQYRHLAVLQQVIADNPALASCLGEDYLITPDIVVSRFPLKDREINKGGQVVAQDECVASLTPLRDRNIERGVTLLHATVSCKWTMRSDRAQNTRTEALNLIRNRKGKTPHIVAVVAEPLPMRLASIAMGTGDVDCTYHMGLFELRQAARDAGSDDQLEMLENLVSGRRLRDISDLPFDLVA